jgi:hypothetical protein
VREDDDVLHSLQRNIDDIMRATVGRDVSISTLSDPGQHDTYSQHYAYGAFIQGIHDHHELPSTIARHFCIDNTLLNISSKSNVDA